MSGNKSLLLQEDGKRKRGKMEKIEKDKTWEGVWRQEKFSKILRIYEYMYKNFVREERKKEFMFKV